MALADTRELPIGTVVRLTGLSSHTLRKWESRYALVSPRRTESGRRVYVQADIDRLVLVRDLSAKGHQLGRLSGLSDDALRDLLDQSSQARTMRAPKRVLRAVEENPERLKSTISNLQITCWMFPSRKR